MTQERQEKIQKLLDDLKEEIFVELDRRVRDTEETLSTQIDDVDTRLKRYRKLREDVQELQKRFSYYKLPYAATVVVGFMLFWYGMWSVLPQIPLFDNGMVAMIAGLILLLVTGTTYKKLVG